MNNLKEIKEKLNRASIKREVLKEEVNSVNLKLEEGLQKFGNLEECRSIIQKAANETQNMLKGGIEAIVTSALAVIPFKESYEFVVDFVQRRNSTECDLLFKRGENTMSPLDSSGYGAADVASFALRVAYWKLNGKLRNTIIIDEPFTNLDKGKQTFAMEMIHKLSEQFDLQFIMTSHEPTIIDYADQIFKVEMIKGESIAVSV
jgi:DNA repair exonuclease SbcCD ATPase subunit